MAFATLDCEDSNRGITVTMHYRSILFRSAAVVAGLVGMTVAASAAPLLTSLQTDIFHFVTLNSSTHMLFDGFDASLGTLTSVHMTLNENATLNDTALVFPFGSGAQTVGSPTPMFASATVSVTGAAGLNASGTLATPGFVGTVADDGVNHTVTTVSGVTGGVSDLTSPPLGLAAYVGGVNTVSLLLSEVGSQGGSVPPEVLSGNNGSADVTVTLQYDYTIAEAPTGVPEPTPMMILGASLIGLGLARRYFQA
jgi:hypothetical protein